MAGSRLYSRETPQVRRLPELTKGDYYKKGSIVYTNRIDSEGIDIYVCIDPHIDKNDSELPFQDSDGRVVDTRWLHWASSRLLDDEMTFASINQKVRRAGFTFDSDMNRFDSDIKWIRDTIPNLPDSDSVDSDLTIARYDISQILQNNITDFVDSDAADENIIVWDSETQKYITKLRVLRVNGQLPDNNGNIVPTLLKVLIGNRDSRPTTAEDATIFITTNDSDITTEGSSFIYSNNRWESIVNPDRDKMDSDFLRLDGGDTKHLFVVNDSENLDSAVTKSYVDEFVKESKQDSFIFIDSEADFDIDNTDSDKYVIRTDKAVLSYFDGNNLVSVGEPAVDIQVFESVSVSTINITITLQCFSPQIPSTLTVKENGVPAVFTFDSDTATSSSITSGVASDFVITDGRNQLFTIIIPTYSTPNEYIIECLTHEGQTLTAQKETNSSDWVVSGVSNDYGTY